MWLKTFIFHELNGAARRWHAGNIDFYLNFLKLENSRRFSRENFFRAVLLKEAAKKSPYQETGLRNIGRLKLLNDPKC